MILFATADLHWGIGVGEADTQRLAEEVCAEGRHGDVLVVAGDIAEERRWSECFGLFDGFPGTKIACAGNHDIWTRNFWDETCPTPESGPSLKIYEELWPAACLDAGWHCLDVSPLVIDGVGFVGGMAWYDYTFRNASLGWPSSAYVRKIMPGDRQPVTNDVRYVRLGMSDVEFTDRLLLRMEDQIRQVQPACKRIVGITHHPCFREMLDGGHEMWTAISGSARIGELLASCEEVVLYIAGHSHEFGIPEVQSGPIRCVNPKSTYHRKNLLRLQM